MNLNDTSTENTLKSYYLVSKVSNLCVGIVCVGCYEIQLSTKAAY